MPPSFVRGESLGKPSFGIRDGIPRQAGISPGAESQRLGPAPGLVVMGWWVTCAAGSLPSDLSPCWCLSSRSREKVGFHVNTSLTFPAKNESL